ncbi:sulfatase [Paenibacillus allorhizosphaerae]|uniref:Ulvan-active sulfatase n=1 Tax=Paenibacillus allorhizosphaerae TaxID=2849866 RepID=A0ABN7TSQ6_9BACL|nr:sulfatase [Paenibacillus allorhizosphaerae]CAG7654328.1 Ulvan-active sulfatase [Paenibacillus allorhizosphaerae]
MAESRKPNILWIFSDQHRAHALSCYGDENIHTPNLDRLAGEGIRFTRAYSNTPLCAPFRATLYTGKYATTHGVVSLHIPLQPGQLTLPEVLQANGYHTSHMGKWHLAGGAASSAFVSPFFRPGWNNWCGWENSNRPWETQYTEGDTPLPLKTLPGYQTDGLTGLTVEWIHKQPADRPWFHVVSIEPPHPPNSAPEKYEAMFRDKPLKLRPNVPEEHPKRDKYIADLRRYYAQIANLDDNVGRILEALEETGQLEDTIVFYFSDHGDLMGSHGMTGKSRPEEESVNIPLIIRYPKRVPQGKISHGYISGVDIMPTLLGMIGGDIPDDVEGTDLSGTVYGHQEEGADEVLLQYERTFFKKSPESSFRSILTEDWSYTCFLTQGPAQLFHLGEDPYQLHNLITDDSYAHVRDKLHTKLANKLQAHNDDFLQRTSWA